MSVIRPTTKQIYGRFIAGITVIVDGRINDVFWKDYYDTEAIAVQHAEESALEVYRATILDGVEAVLEPYSEQHHPFTAN